MNKFLLLNILFLLLSTSCKSQTVRIENKLMECTYQGYKDNGVQLKELILNYQRLLIDKGILKNGSGKSYRKLLQKIADEKELTNVPTDFYKTGLENIEKSDQLIILECQELVLADSSLYDLNTLKKFQQQFTRIESSEEFEPDLIAKSFLDVLSNEDLELDFYKVRIFLLLEALNPDNPLNSKIPVVNFNLENAINIYIDENNKIHVDDKEIKLVELKPLIIKYYQVDKPSSGIYLKTSKQTMYTDYMAVQNEITLAIGILRDKSSRTKFNKGYKDLNEEQKEIIDEEFLQASNIE